jgi:hypothetical protein
MNTGIQILIARMKDHPEEFYDEYGRWKFVFNNLDILTDFEREEWDKSIRMVKKHELEAKRDKLSELVLRGLAGDNEIDDDKIAAQTAYKNLRKAKAGGLLSAKEITQASLQIISERFDEAYKDFDAQIFNGGVQTK